MSVIAVLASSRANRHAMNADKTTRTHLTFSTDAEQPNIDKERESDVKDVLLRSKQDRRKAGRYRGRRITEQIQ